MFTRRALVRFFAIVALTITFAAPQQANAAYVATAFITGDVTKNQWTFYYKERTTDAYPHRISLNKTDGPALYVYMRGCGPSQGQGNGPSVYFPNPDPTGDLRLRETRDYGITFCLAAYSLGNNQTDNFDGNLSWWVN